jgi:hypothetical protein
MTTRFSAAIAVLSVAAPAFAAGAPTSQPSDRQKLEQRIVALEKRIDQLSTKEETTKAQETAQLKQISDDAEEHSQLMSIGGMTSGYEPGIGFVLESDDGDFLVHPGVLVQARYAVSDRNSIYPGDGGATGKVGDDTQNGFEITRFRLTLDGNVINPQLNYFIQLGQDTGMSQVTLFDAYALYRVSVQSPLAIKIGQFKDPVWHEQNLLESRQMAVDRSLASALVGGGELDRVQGAAIVYDQNRARGQIAVHDGYDGLNTPFYGPSGLGAGVSAATGLAPTNWGASARAEYLVIGNREPVFNPFSEYDQFTSRHARQDVLIAGGGLDYSESGANTIVFHTVDAQYNTTAGVSLYGAYLGVYRHLPTDRGVTPGSYYDNAVVLQAAYLLTPQIEPFIRYDYVHLDGKAIPGIVQDNLDEITIGANYYLFGQEAKVTVDGTWLPNGCPTDVNYLDILQDNAHNEFLLRVQFQLAI